MKSFPFRYELLFGVTTADAAFALNNRQLEYGLEPEERNRIFSEFVSTNYGLHQREIFAAIVNEYTDWQSAAQHPVNIRDKTLEALTDAHYVAPLIETGDYHSSLNARSWFYVFEYQTKNSYYKQVLIFGKLPSSGLHEICKDPSFFERASFFGCNRKLFLMSLQDTRIQWLQLR